MMKPEVVLSTPCRDHKNAKSGFSLIEILIATTILLVIVVMASMVFQQATGAFQSGERKIDSQVAIRNILGMISRDLAQAVDPWDYPGIDTLCSTDARRICFIALTGTPGRDDNGNAVRTAQVISYSFSGGVVTRTEQGTTCENGQWRKVGSEIKSGLNSSDNALSDFEFTVVGDDPDVPSRVCVRAEIETTDKISSVGAGSSGRNKKFETGDGKSDDIYVGLNPNH